MTDWEPKSYSQNSTPVQIDEKLLNEEVVILLQGKNIYGDRIYSYIKLTLKSLQQLKSALRNKEDFMPGDFGEVLAAGKGDPTEELRSEMAMTFGMVDVPRPAPPKPDLSKPSDLWEDD